LGGRPVAGRARGREPAGAVWGTAYANDVMAYIPSERGLKEGGSEGDSSMLYYGQPSKRAAGLEGQIVGKVRELGEGGGAAGGGGEGALGRRKGQPPALPREVLGDVSWVFAEPTYATREAFDREVRRQQIEIVGEDTWRPDEVVLPRPRVKVMYEAFDE